MFSDDLGSEYENKYHSSFAPQSSFFVHNIAANFSGAKKHVVSSYFRILASGKIVWKIAMILAPKH